ncbi:unnamed protein product [Nippostrongylus brasiliensis]|uniref:Uncharacterized protein n=1 Tax=Nippostrongylus brasiliensis TaxID=27835 RepID=A0A0N4XXJ0_NIPBR|nr:hypothetical protein Q1695_014681 [Nippostrongylus brasiliensis]VDL71299.1 unnamed protein product [Nippostrongylus brasiliensis]
MDSIWLPTALFLSLVESSLAVYGCPGSGILSSVLGGIGGGYGGFGYGRCGPDTIFYHWTCCDYNVYDCCIQLETWVIIMIVIFAIGIFLCILACIAACIWNYSRNN